MDETIEIHGARIVIKAATPRMTLIDYTAPAGFPGPPLHIHPGYDDVFHILEGELAVRLGDAVRTVGAGETAYSPGTLPHTFANESAAPVRFLSICTPGGFERYLRALADEDRETADAVMAGFGYSVL